MNTQWDKEGMKEEAPGQMTGDKEDDSAEMMNEEQVEEAVDEKDKDHFQVHETNHSHDQEEIFRVNEKCTKQRALLVRKLAKYHLSQLKTDLCIVKNASTNKEITKKNKLFIRRRKNYV